MNHLKLRGEKKEEGELDTCNTNYAIKCGGDDEEEQKQIIGGVSSLNGGRSEISQQILL